MAVAGGVAHAPREYEAFAAGNRAKVNHYLNMALWFFVLTGPAIALGVSAGAFPHADYGACLGISLSMAVLAAVHLLLVKRLPNSMLTSAFALTALDGLIAYVALGHVDVHLVWFLVPLLSLLFCDKRLYAYALMVNYVTMLSTTWVAACDLVSLDARFPSAESYFFNVAGSLTIEMIAMAVSGYLVVRLMSDYFEELFRQQEVIEGQEKNAQEKMDVLDSMAEIYDNVNLISFVDSTEMSLRDAEQKKHGIDMEAQTHTLMNQRIKNQVLPEHLESFLTFTNITTVRERMKGKKIISGDFVDVFSGWFRAQYITVEAAPDGKPDVVIYTTRNVDEEKRREERLIRLSLTDELTGLRNRRSFEEDLSAYRDGGLDDDLVMFSVDVNGLKVVNDTKGHAAGDELIKGAADCLAASVGQAGKVYRTGGDEFMAIVHASEPERVRGEIQDQASTWRGTHVDEMTLAIGFAAVADHPGATVDDLEHIADSGMYADKERHYLETGIDRRRATPQPSRRSGDAT